MLCNKSMFWNTFPDCTIKTFICIEFYHANTFLTLHFSKSLYLILKIQALFYKQCLLAQVYKFGGVIGYIRDVFVPTKETRDQWANADSGTYCLYLK